MTKGFRMCFRQRGACKSCKIREESSREGEKALGWSMKNRRRTAVFLLTAGILCSLCVTQKVPEALGLEHRKAGVAKTAGRLSGTVMMGAEDDYQYLDTTVKVQSFYRAKISWKKKDVDKYALYQVFGGGEKIKKLAVFSGKKSEYVLHTKKNREYQLQIRGWKYKKGTKKVVRSYFGQPYFYSGVPQVGFGDYEWAEGYVSTKKIVLRFSEYENGLAPDGYQMFRRDYEKKKFKRIAVIPQKADWKNGRFPGEVSFTDKNVKAHKAYVYKVRAYKKISGRTCYGPFSEKIYKSAVRLSGAYHILGEPEGDAPVLHVTGYASNGVLEFNPSWFLGNNYISKKDRDFCYQVNGISADGKTWMTKKTVKKTKKISIQGKEGFFLRLEKTRCESDEDDEDDWDDAPEDQLCVDAYYNGIPSFLSLQPYVGTGGTSQNSEAIH